MNTKYPNLILIIEEMGACNGLSVRNTVQWPEDQPLNELELQAEQVVGFGLVSVIADGEESEADTFVEANHWHLLHKFMSDVFDGPYQNHFFED